MTYLSNLLFKGSENRSPDDLQKVKRKKKHRLSGICTVCGDKASANKHYGSKVCFSCRAFFRRLCTKGKMPESNSCNRLSAEVGQCQIDLKSRHLCGYCRYQKCRLNGMEPKLVMSREEIEEMREKAREVKLTGICSGKLPKTEYQIRVEKVLGVKESNTESEEINLETPQIIQLSDFEDFVINDFVPESVIATNQPSPEIEKIEKALMMSSEPSLCNEPNETDETVLMEFIQNEYQTDLIFQWSIDEDWTFAHL